MIPQPSKHPILTCSEEHLSGARALCPLKMAGGKRQLLPEITKHLPVMFHRYLEPFVGGGALFFELGRPAILGDMNTRLIRTYRGIRDDVDGVVRRLQDYPYERGFYERMRGVDVDTLSDVEVAAWMIYVNRAGFNGLYRVSKKSRYKSGFNVPFGRYDNPTICDEPRLRLASLALRRAELHVQDFAETTALAQPGDLVYLDPPYVPLSKTSSFTAYTSDGFSGEDHTRLRDEALRLKTRGVHVILSHSDSSLVRELYTEPSFRLHSVQARRNINSKGGSRGAIGELIIT